MLHKKQNELEQNAFKLKFGSYSDFQKKEGKATNAINFNKLVEKYKTWPIKCDSEKGSTGKTNT